MGIRVAMRALITEAETSPRYANRPATKRRSTVMADQELSHDAYFEEWKRQNRRDWRKREWQFAEAAQAELRGQLDQVDEEILGDVAVSITDNGGIILVLRYADSEYTYQTSEKSPE